MAGKAQVGRVGASVAPPVFWAVWLSAHGPKVPVRHLSALANSPWRAALLYVRREDSEGTQDGGKVTGG